MTLDLLREELKHCKSKTWVCILSCDAVVEIHFELVKDMITAEFTRVLQIL